MYVWIAVVVFTLVGEVLAQATSAYSITLMKKSNTVSKLNLENIPQTPTHCLHWPDAANPQFILGRSITAIGTTFGLILLLHRTNKTLCKRILRNFDVYVVWLCMLRTSLSIIMQHEGCFGVAAWLPGALQVTYQMSGATVIMLLDCVFVQKQIKTFILSVLVLGYIFGLLRPLVLKPEAFDNSTMTGAIWFSTQSLKQHIIGGYATVVIYCLRAWSQLFRGHQFAFLKFGGEIVINVRRSLIAQQIEL